MPHKLGYCGAANGIVQCTKMGLTQGRRGVITPFGPRFCEGFDGRIFRHAPFSTLLKIGAPLN
jgi:hypothetical protein